MMQDVHMKFNPGFPRKSSVQQEEGSFHQQTGLEVKEETINVLHLVLKLGHFRKWIRNTWEVLKCGAGQG